MIPLRLLFALWGLLVFAAPVPAYATPLSVPSIIVDVSWVQAHLGHPNLAVIEISSEVSFEFDGHVPGAAPTTKGVWRDEETDGVYTHRPIDQLEALIRDLGVDPDDAVVVYSKGEQLDDVLGGPYLVWLLPYLGHDNVALMDEGWSAWLAADAPIETETAEIKTGTFMARRRSELLATTDDVLALHKTVAVVDGRPATHFAGTDKFPANTKFGRIPNSISQPWADYIAKDMEGRIYMTSSKPALLKGGALAPDDAMISTCFGGTGSSINYVLFHHYGFKNIRVHDAGIRRWNVRDLPLEKD